MFQNHGQRYLLHVSAVWSCPYRPGLEEGEIDCLLYGAIDSDYLYGSIYRICPSPMLWNIRLSVNVSNNFYSYVIGLRIHFLLGLPGGECTVAIFKRCNISIWTCYGQTDVIMSLLYCHENIIKALWLLLLQIIYKQASCKPIKLPFSFGKRPWQMLCKHWLILTLFYTLVCSFRPIMFYQFESRLVVAYRVSTVMLSQLINYIAD